MQINPADPSFVGKANLFSGYHYDAGGNRILKKINNSETIYVRDASGNVMSTYTNDSTGLYQKEDISMAAGKRNVIKKMLI